MSTPITLDALLREDLHIVSYTPRYNAAVCGVFIAGNVEELAMMAEAMTNSGDYCDHIKHMLFGTPYFPWGEGDNFQMAVADALERINRFPREQWFGCALEEIRKAPQAYPDINKRYVNWEPLPAITELVDFTTM